MSYTRDCGCIMMGERISYPCRDPLHRKEADSTPPTDKMGGRSTSKRRRSNNPRRK